MSGFFGPSPGDEGFPMLAGGDMTCQLLALFLSELPSNFWTTLDINIF
jgi:hypothetical protein